MTASLAIEALNSGELSPLLSGRGSKDFYQTGLKTSLNMIPLVQGPVVQRSGTGFVAEVKDSTKQTAIQQFEFNTTQAYMLEFGDQYMRVHFNHARALLATKVITGITNANPAVVSSTAHGFSNGQHVFIAGVLGMVDVDNREFVVAGVAANSFQLSGIDSTAFGVYTSGGTAGVIYEIATPYVQADLFDSDGALRLKFAQTGDTVYIVHPSYAPRKLTRTGHTAWTLTTAAFTKGPFSSINSDDSQRVMCVATGTTNEAGQTVSVQSNTAIFDANMVGEFFYMEELYLSDNAVSPWGAGTTVSFGAQHSNNGNVYQNKGGISGATGVTAPTHIAGDQADAMLTATGYKIWRYLHSRKAIITLTAFVDSKNMTGTITTYLCDGLAPAAKAISNVTIVGGLFRINSNTHGYGEGDYVKIASVVGTGGMTAAVNGDWKVINVTTNTFDLATSAGVGVYTSGGAATRYATWKWAHGAFSVSRGYPAAVAFHQDRLALAGTAAQPDTVWLSEFGNFDSFSQYTGPDVLATNAIAVTLANGSVNQIYWMTTLTDLGAAALILGTATAEYALGPATTTSPLGPNNVQAPLRSGYGSRSVPPVKVETTSFFVQRAGKKVRDFGQFSYATNSVSGTDLTVRAEHLTKKYPIVDMAWVQEPDALLWCCRFDGQLLSYTHQKEQQVFGWGQHTLGGNSDAGDTLPPLVEEVASIPTPDGRQNELWMVVNRYVNGKTRRYIEYMSPRWVDGDAIATAFMVDAGLTYTGSPVITLSGLYHLIGDTIAILADGKVHKNLVVDATGSITLDYAASTISVGEGFKGRVQPMAIEHPTQTGTAQGKKKIISRALVRLLHTNNVKFGPDFNTLERQNFLTTQSLYDTAVALLTGDMAVTWNGAWDEAAFLCFENDLPVPFGIAAIYPQVETVEVG